MKEIYTTFWPIVCGRSIISGGHFEFVCSWLNTSCLFALQHYIQRRNTDEWNCEEMVDFETKTWNNNSVAPPTFIVLRGIHKIKHKITAYL